MHDLVYAALVEYPRYVDPETGQRCELERAIEWMALQRRMARRAWRGGRVVRLACQLAVDVQQRRGHAAGVRPFA